ncbi:MAG: hypothetical protein VX569_12360 [Pseudomonadota bacterium]|nr:hypothetical protein [Pseudomonadota bacterium]
MKKLNASLATASALAFALAACGEPEVAETDNAMVEEDLSETAEYDPSTRDYTLTEEAQARRDAFDETAFQEEYGTYRDDIMSEPAEPTGSDAGDPAEAQAASAPRDPQTNMRARENMTFAYLDRNDDGQLSVAEYAIWAIPLDPTAPRPDDQNAPRVTAEQANKAADSFFYYDRDGDTYLSQSEFQAARSGADVA